MSYNGKVRHRNQKNVQAIRIGTYQFHELQNVKAHPDSFRQGGNVPTVDTGLGGLDHSLDITVSHRGAVAFESFSKDLKETRSVPDAMVDFLLNKVRVEYRSDVIRLRCELIKSRLERGVSDGRIEDARWKRLYDREEDFQKFREQMTNPRSRS
jgi:hypothetical protein